MVSVRIAFQNRQSPFSKESFYEADLEHITRCFLILVNKVIM